MRCQSKQGYVTLNGTGVVFQRNLIAMANTTTDPNRLKIPPFILIGIWLAIGFWVLEAYFDSLLVENVSFAMRLFPSDLNELWMRSFTCVLFIGFGLYSHRVHARIQSAETISVEAGWLLKNALSNTIRGDFKICVFCRKIRDKDGLWVSPDRFIVAQTEAEISGSMCNECQIRHSPDEAAGQGREN